MDQFGELCRGHTCAPASASHARAAPCDKDEVMQQEPLEEERECHEYMEEVDSWKSSLQSSTDNDRHIEEAELPESSLQSSTDTERQTEGEDEVELLDKPTGGPMDETAVKHIEGCPPSDEPMEEHPPGDGFTEGHPLDY